MKIGEFSQKFNVPISTIRYYIDRDLLLPEKDGAQYRFTEEDCRQMEVISSMKDAGFKLGELNKIMNLYRFYNEKDFILYGKLADILAEKKQALCAERDRISSFINIIDKKIHELSGDRPPLSPQNDLRGKTKIKDSPLPGFPLNAVSLLYCPDCQNKLDILDVRICGELIVDGRLKCSCGYTASIVNGILITDGSSDLEHDPDFFKSYFGEEDLLKFDIQDPVPLIWLNSFSNECLANVHMRSMWIRDELKDFDLNDKTILLPDISSVYLYKHYDNEKSKDNTFIVTALTEPGLRAMRRHIANSYPNLKVVYIINQDGRLPLKNSCIDVIIDCFGSFNLGFFLDRHYYDMIGRYMAENTVIFGTVNYYDQGSPSLKRIHELYAHSAAGCSTFDFFSSALRRNGFHIAKSKEFGRVSEPGEFFEYHLPGDKIKTLAFLAEREGIDTVSHLF